MQIRHISTLYLAQMAWSQLEPTSWEEDSTRIVPARPTTAFSSSSECKERVKQEYVEHNNSI